MVLYKDREFSSQGEARHEAHGLGSGGLAIEKRNQAQNLRTKIQEPRTNWNLDLGSWDFVFHVAAEGFCLSYNGVKFAKNLG